MRRCRWFVSPFGLLSLHGGGPSSALLHGTSLAGNRALEERAVSCVRRMLRSWTPRSSSGFPNQIGKVDGFLQGFGNRLCEEKPISSAALVALIEEEDAATSLTRMANEKKFRKARKRNFREGDPFGDAERRGSSASVDRLAQSLLLLFLRECPHDRGCLLPIHWSKQPTRRAGHLRSRHFDSTSVDSPSSPPHPYCSSIYNILIII